MLSLLTRFPHRRAWLLLALTGLVEPASVHAEALDFRQCVAVALSQNPEVTISQAQIAQAEAAVRQAQGNRLPRVNLSLTATRSNDALNAFGMKLSQRQATFDDFGAGEFLDVFLSGSDPLPIAPDNLNHPDAVNNFNSRIEVLVPVYSGGQVQSYIDTAKAYVRAAQAGDRMARQQIVKQVLMAYQGVHTARAYIKVAEEGVKAAEEYVRVSERLQAQGMAVKSDVLSARVNLEDVKVKLTQARNAEATALDQLHLLLGKPLGEPLDVAEAVMPGFLDGAEDALRHQAREQNPGLRALRQQVDAAGGQVRAAQAGRKPQFNVMLRQDWNDDDIGFDAPSYTLAGVLSWTAFDGGSSKAAVDRAGAARSELLARLRQAEEGVDFQVTEARRKALEAEATAAARELAVTQAEEAQRLVRKRYESGVGTLIEILAAQAQLDRAKAALVGVRHDLAVQRAELKRAVGVLDVEQL